MIIVRIKDRIYELRQFDDEARNYLINMIRKKELIMVAARKKQGISRYDIASIQIRVPMPKI